jgi:hypothetical protein
MLVSPGLKNIALSAGPSLDVKIIENSNYPGHFSMSEE